jgi:hypothetical protein
MHPAVSCLCRPCREPFGIGEGAFEALFPKVSLSMKEEFGLEVVNKIKGYGVFS